MTAEERKGFIFAIGAYVAWGFFPLYWHLFDRVPPAEILCHRIIWSFVFFMLLLKFRKLNFIGLMPSISSRARWRLLLAALIISLNWFIYIYAVTTGHVLESSLGYFINPLVSIFLGFLFLKERLSLTSWLAVFLAFLGVANMIYHSESVIWIPLSLAVSFGSYGLIRKTLGVSPLLASTFETLILLPFAFLYLALFHVESVRWLGLIGADTNTFLLVLGGVVTGLPLLWFTEGAVRIPLSSMGFLQYIAPTLQFLTAVLVFKEAFGKTQVVTFGLIWFGILVFVGGLVRKETQNRKQIRQVVS